MNGFMENKQIKILAIDDNPDNLVVLKALFTETFPNANLVSARSGKTGIELCINEKPDVVLLDIVMPEMDGYEVCRAIKSHYSIKHIPVVMITAARTDKESRIKALESGADGFLAKPLDESELTAQVKAMLRIKESEDRKLNEKAWLEKLVLERTEALERELHERKKAEEAILEGKIRYQAIVESTNDWVWAVDKNGCYNYASPKIRDFLGFEPEEVIGKTPFDFMPADEAIRVGKIFKKISEERSAFSGLENLNKKKNGEIIILETNGVPVFDSKGNFSGYHGVDHDITNRKKAENNLKESEEKYRKLVEFSPDSVLIHTNGIIRFANAASAKLFGAGDKQDLIGKKIMDLVHPDYQNIVKQKINKITDEKEEVSVIEEKLISLTGRIFDAEVSEVPITLKGHDGVQVVSRDITERKISEDKLRDSEAQFKCLFEGAADAIFVAESDSGIIIDANQAACRLLQMPYEKIIGLHQSRLHPPEEEKYYRNNFLKQKQEVKQKQPITPVEGKVICSDGSETTVEIMASLVTIKGKVCMMGTFRDITERKRNEAALRESSERFRSIAESANDAIITSDNKGKILDWNTSAENMFGFLKDEIVGEDLTLLMPQQFILPHVNGIRHAGNNNTQHVIGKTVELQGLHKSGKVFPVELSLANWECPSGKYFTAIIRDITQRKRIEKVQKLIFDISNKALTATNLDDLMDFIKTEIGTLIDTTNFFIALYDEEYDTITLPYYVDKIDKYTSFPAGKTMTAFVIKSKKSILAKGDTIARLAASGIVETIGTRSKIWLGVPLEIKGKVTGAIVVQSYDNENAFSVEDQRMLEFVASQISVAIERKKTEQELKDALVQAHEAERLKSTFLATMSHELRTPLNAIIGFSELLKEELPAKNIVEFARIINNSGEHLLELVEEIFDITLIESGQVKIQKDYFLLNPYLKEIHEIIGVEQSKMGKEGITLIYNEVLNDEDLMIFTDPFKVKQILINLLKNALKFTSEGFVEFGYRMISHVTVPLLEFYVKDTGPGIPRESQEIIFEIFRQVDDSHTRAYGGTGIGLSVAKKLTERLGGKIKVKSKVGVGSTFYFTIPYTENGFEEPILKEETVVKTRRDFSNKTILVAEDEDSNFELLDVLLTNTSATVIRAKNGKEAVEFCRSIPNIDLILMDLRMPVMTGYEATMEIRKFFTKLPIIAQTAYAMPGDNEKALAAGCDDYVSKPIKKQVLMEKIEKYLGGLKVNTPGPPSQN